MSYDCEMKTDFLMSLSGIDLTAIFFAAFVVVVVVVAAVADGIFFVGVDGGEVLEGDGGFSVPSEFPLLSVE